ncbi:MAG: hypothetical protein HZB13_19280 [Acidobacteria bacterium]|nr:hypothetical protein [Acidobacteriota bacterium]
MICGAAAGQTPAVEYRGAGYTTHGEWTAEVSVTPHWWAPGEPMIVRGRLLLKQSHLNSLQAAGIKVTGAVVLATAERTFDAEGKMRQAAAEKLSTVLTVTGLPIEGGVQGAATKRFGYGFNTPFDQLATIPLNALQIEDGTLAVPFELRQSLPQNLPPGIYRVRVDYGVTTGKANYDLNGEAFAKRSFPKGRICESHHYSPVIRANGFHASGRWVDGIEITPRVPWVLLNSYNSNGYRGVVAEEDKGWFALASRNLIQDDVILPLFDASSRPIGYNLEPQSPLDSVDARLNIPWDGTRGELTVEVTDPEGVVAKLGTMPFAGLNGAWPTTKKSAVTAWKPAKYGRYTVKATGRYYDVDGNSYEGGGTYRFWIAKRMTLATATFQGMAYPVGNRYGRDIGFSPAFPAEVEVEATLYVNSDPRTTRVVRYSGKASPAGLFGSAQGMKPLAFDAPGEYVAQVLAQHLDQNGHLWVCSMRHAGIVYPVNSPIVARGKKLSLPGGKIADRGETLTEGYVGEDGVSHLAHINYPYNQNDVLLIASEGQGANKIEPVLIYEWKDNPQPYDAGLQGIGNTNLKLFTSNGYAPHLFPEYITERGYYYGAAPRPGFMSRFIVGEHGVRAPYWPTSPNSFGGQVNASNNGDLPGDIYRLIGGVALFQPGKAPAYAGYLASAFILPRGEKNNRVIAPGAEDVPGPYYTRARVFLVGTRPGLTYETGTSFAPALQIDPVLPVKLKYTLRAPDGKETVWEGTGDGSGSFAGATRVTLEQPGLYRFKLEGEWDGHTAVMPGLPAEGGELYVIEKDRPAAAPQMKLDLPEESNMDPVTGTRIKGRSTAKEVYAAAVIPGAVLDQAVLPVKDGVFEYVLNPKVYEQKTQTYDTAHRVTGKPEVFDVIHLTFFSKEEGPGGTAHSFQRVIIRGTKLLCVK